MNTPTYPMRIAIRLGSINKTREFIIHVRTASIDTEDKTRDMIFKFKERGALWNMDCLGFISRYRDHVSVDGHPYTTITIIGEMVQRSDPTIGKDKVMNKVVMTFSVR